MRSAAVKTDLQALFEGLGLATPQGNRGLTVVPASGDRWAVKLRGHVLAYDQQGFAEGDLRAAAIGESRTFFLAYERTSPLVIANFAASDFEELDRWRRNRLAAGVGPVKTLADVEEAYSLLVQLLDDQLRALDRQVDAASRIYLLNLIMARKQGWLPTLERRQFAAEVPELALPLLRWWNGGVGVEYALHFFNPYIGGGFIKAGNSLFSTTVLGSKSRPALNMRQVKQLEGVSIGRLRALYPNGAERF